MRVLVVNAGSSSLKLGLLDDDGSILAERNLAAPRAEVDSGEVAEALESGLGDADAVGHRIVHGGSRFQAPLRLDSEVAGALWELADLAPLHQPKSLAALKAVSEALPAIPAVACFDTAFHATMPPKAATYALPAAWRDRWALRRYGFHGLSHGYAARRGAELLDRPLESLRIVSCHLGAGASLAAVSGGVSVDTTMGFTPLEGLVMATRSGSVDPGLLLWLLEHEKVGERALAETLEHESGLLALAGTADMAEVVSAAEAGREDARLAFDVYVHRLRAGIAAMSAATDGVDLLIFTGGVGENAPAIRAAAAEGLRFLGIYLDERRNDAADGDEDISADGANARALVVKAREDLEIAHQVRSVLATTEDSF
ncbi:MAG: acetate kinase [Alphaproteobacteria bacterium]|nr:MAG: acetate kinase [Alphaproteobacteria bacterium]